MTHPLNHPNMVKTCALEGEEWSPDHPAQLPLALILAWALELSRPKLCDGCSSNRNMFKINWKKEKENAWKGT